MAFRDERRTRAMNKQGKRPKTKKMLLVEITDLRARLEDRKRRLRNTEKNIIGLEEVAKVGKYLALKPFFSFTEDPNSLKNFLRGLAR